MKAIAASLFGWEAMLRFFTADNHLHRRASFAGTGHSKI
jgi:hypothetical protein